MDGILHQIMEGYLFNSRIANPSIRKTTKNTFRALVVALTGVVALFCGGKAYDNFVSLIGKDKKEWNGSLCSSK